MRIGFIGAGKMAQALAKGLITSGRYEAANIITSSPKTDGKMLDECKFLGVNTTYDNTEVVETSDVIFVAVKPGNVAKVAAEIAPIFERKKLLVSIALGITIRNIETLLPPKSRVVRVMPNTPCLVGAGASAFSIGSACYDGDSNLVQDLLSTVGYAVEVPEVLIDPVTGLSGSGPSYMFSVIEGLADGGVKMGIPRDLSIRLAAYTLLGASKMVLETGIHPAILKEAVQSPAGSSVYGIHEIEKGNLKATLMSAVEAATNRSRATGSDNLPRHSMEMRGNVYDSSTYTKPYGISDTHNTNSLKLTTGN
uniref:Pyrroline-5-carboxylate reductase n=1 Tax=Strongyloides venezuelensis TaxID=75913 RepID=A0A0K0FU33_STRVS